MGKAKKSNAGIIGGNYGIIARIINTLFFNEPPMKRISALLNGQVTAGGGSHICPSAFYSHQSKTFVMNRRKEIKRNRKMKLKSRKRK